MIKSGGQSIYLYVLNTQIWYCATAASKKIAYTGDSPLRICKDIQVVSSMDVIPVPLAQNLRSMCGASKLERQACSCTY